VKYLSLNLEAQSPLVIRADHAAGGASSAGYISGTALLGSLAAAYRSYYPENAQTFERLFLNGGAQYPDLYPSSFKSPSMQNANTAPIYPLPKTAQSCKRFDGFPYVGDEKERDKEGERHGVRDSLLDWAMFEIGKRANAVKDSPSITVKTLLQPLESHKECPVCNGENPMDHFSGFYRRIQVNGRPRMAKAEAGTRLLTRTGINRETGTVQEGILYNRRVFDEHTRFWGMLKMPEDLADSLADFIKEVGQSGLVRIGTGRTRGSGKVHLSVEPRVDEQESFETRLQKFDELLRKQTRDVYKEYKETIKPYLEARTFYFALTLHSPAILRDEMLRYRGSIDARALCGLLGMPEDSAGSFELIYQAAGARRVMGWNEMWGTPRTNEYAIDTGSVFLFAFKGESKQVDPLKQALLRLEEEGIGQRKAEGFGRVCICDPFHREVEL
jgi:CRISPR-associated protein Csx10